MRIQGLQKLTLLDYPGKTACTIFLGGCNFRCPFCHNAALVTGVEDHENFSEEELFDFLKRRQGILDGVCISGGEPLICPYLYELLKKILDMGYLIKLDTNGSFPERLIRLVEEGLIDQVAMDLKNSREKYARTVGLGQFDVRPIEESVEYLLEGHVPYAFRTTVVREFHQKSDFEEMGRWIRGAATYYIQQFENSGGLIREGLHAYDEPVLLQVKAIMENYVGEVEIRGI